MADTGAAAALKAADTAQRTAGRPTMSSSTNTYTAGEPAVQGHLTLVP